jgi:N-acetylneuraminic acid mutarotase
MKNARIYHTASVLHNGKVLVTGGCNGSRLNSAELYDPATRTWTVTGSLNNARSLHTASVLPNGKVLVTGGIIIINNLNGAELCDILRKTFTIFDKMNNAQNNRKVFVNGRENYVITVNSSELYDPLTGIWTITGSMNYPRGGHTASVLPNGKVLVVGGLYGESLSTAELYDHEFITERAY